MAGKNMREVDTETPVIWPAWCYTGKKVIFNIFSSHKNRFHKYCLHYNDGLYVVKVHIKCPKILMALKKKLYNRNK